MSRAGWPLAAVISLSVVVAACGSDLPGMVEAAGLRGAAVVRLSDGYAVAARQTDGGVEVLAFRVEAGSWRTQVIASSDSAGPDHVQLVSFGGQTGEEWNSFVFGRAGPAVSRVVLDGLAGSGGQVIDGAWVIALRARDVAPSDVRWRFQAADGGVLRSGVGLLP